MYPSCKGTVLSIFFLQLELSSLLWGGGQCGGPLVEK